MEKALNKKLINNRGYYVILCLCNILFLLLCNPCFSKDLAAECHGSNGDLLPIDLEDEGIKYELPTTQKMKTYLKRINANVYLIEKSRSNMIGKLMFSDDGNYRVNDNMLNGHDILIADINFDGKQEFFIRNSLGLRNSSYYIVNKYGKNIDLRLFFSRTAFQMLSDFCLEEEKIYLIQPYFNKKDRELSICILDGHYRYTVTFIYNNGYKLKEYNRPYYCGSLIINKKNRYMDDIIMSTRVSTFEGDKQVMITITYPTILFTAPHADSHQSSLIAPGSIFKVIDAYKDYKDEKINTWFKVEDISNHTTGWLYSDASISVWSDDN